MTEEVKAALGRHRLRRHPDDWTQEYLEDCEVLADAYLAELDPKREDQPISPKDLSFQAVNDFVHDSPHYEHLQGLCLSLACKLNWTPEWEAERRGAVLRLQEVIDTSERQCSGASLLSVNSAKEIIALLSPVENT